MRFASGTGGGYVPAVISRTWTALRTSVRALATDFANRDSGLLGISTALIWFATWCFTIALGVYGFDAHGAAGVGIVALVRFLPAALVSPLVGLLIDRFPRRSVMLGSAVASTAVLAGAAAAAALGAPTDVVFAFPALFAVAICGYAPAHAALMPTLVETPQQLSAANVSHSVMENAGTLAAALVAGLLLSQTSPAFVIGLAAAAALVVSLLITGVGKDQRPEYALEEDEVAGAFREVTRGARALFFHPALRLSSATMVLLFFFEGFIEVMVVVVALEMLHLAEGAVGFLNATIGIGAVLGAVGLAMLFDRGRLVPAIAGGSLLIGAATVLPGLAPHAATAYAGMLGIGIGFVFAEVATKTLMQRLGSDETFGRVVGALESGRQAALAVGSIGAVLLVELLHPEGALIAVGAFVPIFVTLCWTRLRAHEIGAPADEERYRLLRRSSIFSPLPLATLERLSHDLQPVEVQAGEKVIVQGEVGDRFFLICEGEVEVFEDGVFRRNEGPGECFGEIALLHDVPRTATVQTTQDTRLLALDRDRFLLAVTGHRRSRQLAHRVSDERWPGDHSATAVVD
ncbi:MAG TPA: MFS transporter [Solirubrobacterales bacterium]|nr:MFS transporter [Solirubrobacterales bacterium]